MSITARLAMLVLIGVLPSCEASPDQSPAATRAAGSGDVGRSDVAALNCRSLLTNALIELALGIPDRPVDQRDSVGRSRGEICTEALVVDEQVFVRIEPGAPGDFTPEAELLGVPGDPVSAVGDDARWFGGPAAEGGGTAGILSVRRSTSLGALHFRIALGRPDLGGVAQLELAQELALGVLPRFPGVEPPPPVEVTIERAPIDRSNVSFVDNLLSKEAAGEWTRGEGLVATLRLFAGEVDAAEVLRRPELVDASGEGLIQMAREYLEVGPDSGAKAEIASLLERLDLSRERLEGMADTTATAGTTPTAGIVLAKVTAPRSPGSTLLAAPGDAACQLYWGVPAPCLIKVTSPELDAIFGAGKYKVWFPNGSAQAGSGWTTQDLNRAVQAMTDSALQYDAASGNAGMGSMPARADIIFTSLDMGGGETTAGECTVLLIKPMQQQEADQFQQQIAARMARCMIKSTFPVQTSSHDVARWWVDGLAIWLSTVVYPKANGEWNKLPAQLASEELGTTLLDRGSTNWLFFEHTEDAIGWQGNLDLVGTLPPTSRTDHEDHLAAFPGMEPLLHTFAQGLSDEDIPDSGGGSVPYGVRADTVPISGRTLVVTDPQRFGVVRLHLVVDPGKTACIEYHGGGDLRSSWRARAPGAPGGSWSDDLPDSLRGEAVLVVTTIQAGTTFEIEVTDVGDDPRCEDNGGGGPPAPKPCPLDCAPSSYYYKEG